MNRKILFTLFVTILMLSLISQTAMAADITGTARDQDSLLHSTQLSASISDMDTVFGSFNAADMQVAFLKGKPCDSHPSYLLRHPIKLSCTVADRPGGQLARLLLLVIARRAASRVSL